MDAVFPGERLMRLEVLHRRVDAPRLRDDLRQADRANGGAGAFRGKRGDPQRLPAGGFRLAGKILHHDSDARSPHRAIRQQFGPAGQSRKPVGHP